MPGPENKDVIASNPKTQNKDALFAIPRDGIFGNDSGIPAAPHRTFPEKTAIPGTLFWLPVLKTVELRWSSRQQQQGPYAGRLAQGGRDLMPKSKSITAGEIPLYLLPRAIALQINRMGDKVYRISVKRTHWHHYNVSVRTKSVCRELRPVPVAVVETGLTNSRGVRIRGDA